MSNDELAASIGLATFIGDAAGIGGLIKARVEDFRVEEEGSTPSLDRKGRFTVARITLSDWETNRFVNRLAGSLKISRKRIWFSGTKDKRAVTTQLFVIDAQESKVRDFEMKDVDIEILGRTHQKLAMGSHAGNRFSINVRGCSDESGNPLTQEQVASITDNQREALVERLGEGRFPNWVGPQRFGSTRPVTAEVGRAVVEGRFSDAVDLYLGMEGFREKEDCRDFRSMWRDTKDAEKCLEHIPHKLNFERDILTSLVKKPDDYVSAFRRLPNNLQLMTVHAIQSLAFNHTLAARIDSGLPLATPVIGDVVGPILESGKVDTGKLTLVNERNITRIGRNCKRGRLAVTGALPGKDTFQSKGDMAELEAGVVDSLGLSEIDWHVTDIPRLTSRGTRRSLTGTYSNFSMEAKPAFDLSEENERWAAGPTPGDRWHPEGACVNFRFDLPPGTYATTLLREFTRAPIHQS